MWKVKERETNREKELTFLSFFSHVFKEERNKKKN